MSATTGLWHKNKNYGNIRYNESNKWKGQTGQTSGFVKFDSFVNGIRAMFLLLNTYSGKKANTISTVVNRYAPSSDGNDTTLYINNVEKWSGVEKGKIFKPASSEGVAIVKAMIRQETGEIVPEDQLAQGFARAFDSKNSDNGLINTNSDSIKKKILEKAKEKKILIGLVIVLIVGIIVIRKK